MTFATPRAHLLINGQVLACEEISVSQSKDNKSDSFDASMSLWGLPPGMDANFWSTATNVEVQVMVDVGNGAKKLFDGMVDSADEDFDSGKLSISGRDKASKLIDKKSSKKFQNKKPHEVVKQLASDAGLEADVDEITDKAGKIVQIDYNAIQHRSSDWLTILDLADKHGRVAYISGGKVYFKKPDEKLPVLSITFKRPDPSAPADSNAVKLSAKRNLTLGRPVKHKVSSWNHKQQKLNEDEFQEDGDGDPIEWHHHFPGLSKDEAKKRAKDHCDKTTKHELGVTVDMPGNPDISPRYLLELTGTGTAYDQQHEIASVKHRLSQKGYRMTLNTKAKSKKRGKGGKGGGSKALNTAGTTSKSNTQEAGAVGPSPIG